MATIVLGRTHVQGAPGTSLATWFRKGETVAIRTTDYIDWPGKPYGRGTIGDLCDKERRGHDKWAFWTSHDIDIAAIFHPGDVAELVLTAAEAATFPKEVLGSAPFTVRVEQ